MVWLYIRISHTSHITNIRAVSSIYQHVIYLVTYCVVRWSPGDLVNVLVLIPCWVTAKSLPSTKFTTRFPKSFFTLWRPCPPHSGYQHDSLQFQRLSPLVPQIIYDPSTVCMSYCEYCLHVVLWPATHTVCKELQNYSSATSSLSSGGAFVDNSVKL